ncbi:5'/3'-nucleotidase SurE [Desulfosporosinus nitroreducens]|uniref:5'-nucleotidase SurE n=1 Tax=Desulfosporosinus nitroreducens TaxID=2018668 RepID=A0ABT8QMX0_9FIRM|nr:5'/3'-nucleotidase SurE [Desulfosporosinus nitroreducens]MCO1600360.1 5'/3'-nucleotidase SurE [Desulfosporosinus nitroreducens]MDO0821448.1 5'/3'-nucleotidase SurE [Desulfosporosinus nitroreducens]
MHILLTNDDGYHASGIQTLYRSLRSLTEHDISIVAPEGERSATGHSITLFHPLFVTEHDLDSHQKGFAVSGTPSDCVKLAVQGGLITKPDLLISGINQGSNLGTDVFYSGTVSAAMEGVILGVPSLAVSLANYQFTDFEPSAVYLAKHLDYIVKPHKKGLMNINFPGKPQSKWAGVKVTRLGKAIYDNVFERRVDPHGRAYYWQCGNRAEDLEEDTDLRAIQEDFISITPMHSDLTDFKGIEPWKKYFNISNSLLDNGV